MGNDEEQEEDMDQQENGEESETNPQMVPQDGSTPIEDRQSKEADELGESGGDDQLKQGPQALNQSSKDQLRGQDGDDVAEDEE